ncbi:uncharacterized protein LOC128814123 [Vidua macroura]|uniref:uncharacterized protein LOC128814123 n=1 Tax=Vidua macroura TaxID=187451 RepID=UPI0023A808ED|nr:uncharacterized protein LOC128814123 [Vidua macroura]
MRQMLAEIEQAGQDMEGEAVLKAAFPRGSSNSVPASAAGREAMPGTVTGDEIDEKASPLAWLNKVLKPLEPPAAVSAGRNFPAPLLIAPRKPGSLRRGSPKGKNKGTGKKKFREPNNILKQTVMEVHKEHGMDREALWKAAFPQGREAMPGTVTGDWDHELENLVNGGLKTLPEDGGKLSIVGPPQARAPPGPAPEWEAELSECLGGHQSPRGTLCHSGLRENLQQRHRSCSVLPFFADNPVGESDLAYQPTFRIEPLGDAEVTDRKAGQKEVFPQRSTGPLAAPAAEGKAIPCTGTGTGDAASTTAPVPDSQKGIGRGFCQGTGCWLGLMAGMLHLELIFILCCAQIWKYWKRKCCSSGQEMKAVSSPHMHSLSSTSSSNKGLVSPIKSSEKRTPVHLSTRKPPMTM